MKKIIWILHYPTFKGEAVCRPKCCFISFVGLFLFVSSPGLRVESSFAEGYMNVMLKSITEPVTAKPQIYGCSSDPGIYQRISTGFISIK